MIEAGGGLGFAAETGQRFAGIGVIAQDPLDGDDAAGMALAGAIDDAHSTTTDFLKDLVIPKAPVLVGQIDLGERADQCLGIAPVVWSEAALEEAADAKSACDMRGGIAMRTRRRVYDHARDGVGESGESHGRRSEVRGRRSEVGDDVTM